MGRDGGFTLVEALVCASVVLLASALAMPTINSAVGMARLAVCASTMHGLHSGLMFYAAASGCRTPPFAFSGFDANLPLSGHWGGATVDDPTAFGRWGVGYVNLWSLVLAGHATRDQLLCPAAAEELHDGRAGYFPCTPRFSTYCLRFPASDDLFREAPQLAGSTASPLVAYVVAAGGQSCPIPGAAGGSGAKGVVPQVRLDRRYRIIDDAACGDGDFDPVEDTILADAFWRQDYAADAPPAPPLRTYPVRQAWCHGARFNILDGTGGVRTVDDEGTVRDNTVPPGGELERLGPHYATRAERVWQWFDSAGAGP